MNNDSSRHPHAPGAPPAAVNANAAVAAKAATNAAASVADNADDADASLATALLADALAPIAPAPPRADSLRARLLDRASRSVAARRGVHTLRARDNDWQPYVKGVCYRLLHSTPTVRSLLVQFDPGATLPPHRHGHHEECMVLSGNLVMGALELRRGDYHLAPARSRHAGLVSPEGALIYLRGAAIGSGRAAVREVLGALLPSGRDQPLTVFADADGWTEPLPGVQMKPLWSGAGHHSRLYRFARGAACADDRPAAESECVMLDGDAYFGDTLVRAGDYQFVEAGARHGAVSSDDGALFFVHAADAAPG